MTDSIFGLPLIEDPEVPPGEVWVKNADGTVLKIVNIEETNEFGSQPPASVK